MTLDSAISVGFDCVCRAKKMILYLFANELVHWKWLLRPVSNKTDLAVALYFTGLKELAYCALVRVG